MSQALLEASRKNHPISTQMTQNPEEDTKKVGTIRRAHAVVKRIEGHFHPPLYTQEFWEGFYGRSFTKPDEPVSEFPNIDPSWLVLYGILDHSNGKKS